MKLTALLKLTIAVGCFLIASEANTEPTRIPTNEKGAAPFALAADLLKGQGVPKNEAMAAHFFRLSAEQGNADAQDMLGLLYKSGQGVLKDNREAIKWFLTAAESGHADAQNNLGTMYSSGQGVPQDFKEAVKWFRLSANQGYSNAQNNLAVAYDNGQGVPKSWVVAYALFNLASGGRTSNDDLVTASRKSVAGRMSMAEVEEAQALTRELVKPQGLLLALDAYIKKARIK